MNAIATLIDFLSAEFVLRWRANGGAVVFVRTVWVALIIYAIALALKMWAGPLPLDPTGVRGAVSTTIPWLGAIFAVVYAAFYARFASQWAYLADLYNRQMEASLDETVAAKSQMAVWEAGFIEDAVDLHLAEKPMFAEAILCILKKEEARGIYLESAKCRGDQMVLRSFEARLDKALRRNQSRPVGPALSAFFRATSPRFQ